MKKKSNSISGFYKTAISSIEMKSASITIGEISEGYVNNSKTEEGGVFSMNGKLNIRPKYQRSYVRENDNDWREALILSIIYQCPIALFYIALNADGTKSLLDGQQRLITICDFINGDFKIEYCNKPYYFNNLPTEIQNAFLSYELEVKLCKGTEDALIKWFFIINQPNAVLTAQELRNSIYGCPWTESAKKFFSRVSNGHRTQITDPSDKYYYGAFMPKNTIDPTRQEVLEVVIDWISYRNCPALTTDTRIENYMAVMMEKNAENANELIAYYKEVCDFVYDVFLRGYNNKKPIRCVSHTKWGKLYADFAETISNLTDEQKDYVSSRFQELSSNIEVTMHSRIAEWILGGEREDNENILQPRTLNERECEQLYKMQGAYFPNVTKNGIDYSTWTKYELDEMEQHHILSWRNGGKTEYENMILLPTKCHEVLVHGGIYGIGAVKELRKEVFAYNNEKRVKDNVLAHSVVMA